MFVLKRNHVIITALVIMIAIAGYLNYADSKAEEGGITQMMLNDNGELSPLISDESYYSSDYGEIDDALTLGDDVSILMDDAEAAGDTGAQSTAEPGEAVFVNTSSDSSYFVQAKLDREQTRAKQRELLMGMINDSQLDQDTRAECADSLLDIQKRLEKESSAESMIEAKGFNEVYVRIDDETVDVIVNKEALSDAEIAQIEDIVKRKTGMAAEQIRISPIKQ
ncbi:MAG: SpoIIIAH-like family protein [Clostridiales bacterium]|nr:SpoIIIAH-like family protein [Clostridiales bacterium]